MLKYCIKLRNKVAYHYFNPLEIRLYYIGVSQADHPKSTQKSQLHIVVVASNLISQFNTIFYTFLLAFFDNIYSVIGS